jgi:putative aldouronate transport system permease protein
MERNNMLKMKEPKQKNRSSVADKIKRHWQLYLMLLIPLSFVFVFNYMPYPGLRMAFMDYKPAKGWDSDWVGLETFQRVFSDRDFWRALRNTISMNLIQMIASFPAPIILALILNELHVKFFKRVSQTILYLPHFLSTVIIASVAYTLFKTDSGMINVALTNAGIIAEKIPFLTEKYHWVATYVLINVWQGIGWGSIIYLSAITGINTELYEAAAVDGAGRFKRLIHITLPSIKPTIVMLLIMNIGGLLGSSFERLTAFGNVNVKEVQYQLSIYVFEKGIRGGGFSRSTAVGLFLSLVSLMLVLISDKIAKSLGEDGLI